MKISKEWTMCKKYYDPVTTDMDQNSDSVNEHTPVFVDVVLLRRTH